jgi:aryl-alcohol dehydrogenase-like predicted oxidoreductase
MGAMATDFLHRPLPVVGKQVHRLGLSFSFGIDPDGVAAAIDRGMNYFFWTSIGTGRVLPVVREALERDRERFVLCSGSSLTYIKGSVRRAAEKWLRAFNTDYLDVFQIYWLGKMAFWTDGIRAELVKLKEQGKVRALAVSVHDRPWAARLADDSPLDLLMLRYNAAHPGAEVDVFPHLARRKPAVVAYTATSWRKLLRPPRGWDGPAMTAGDCYRFCLSSPHVDVVLCGPKNRAQLEQNLGALEQGPLSPDEEAWMRRFGKVVHG